MPVGYGGRTYRPGLLLACKVIRRYIVTWQTKLEQTLGEAGYATLLLILETVETMITYLETNSDA